MPGTDKMFPLVKPGDPIKADAWNEITTQLIALSNLGDSCDVIATGAGTFRRVRRRGGGSTGGAQIVQFAIETVDCDAGTATATVTNVMCDGTTGVAVGDTINLVDDDGCWLVGNEQILIGQTGKAVSMDAAYECAWSILSMPCLAINC